MKAIARLKQLHPALSHATAHLDEDVSLSALAGQAGVSEFHLHRLFSVTMRETPKQLTLRLRLGRAAVLLLTGRDSVLDVALACGFQSHEVFCRAFRRRFGIAPRAYRERGLVKTLNRAQMLEHASLVNRIGPCVRLYHFNGQNSLRNEMAYSITTKELHPQPVVVTRKRMKQSEIGAMLGEMFGRVFQYAQQHGVALAGAPFARYLEMRPGLMTIEAGFPVVAAPALGSGEIAPDSLPGGLAAVAMHTGPYDKLQDAHAAIQEWIESQGLTTAGAPWESYVTDPAQFPNPQDWKTEVFWPVRS